MDALDPNWFVQFGAFGIFSFILTVFARGAYKREVDRGDRLEARNEQLNDAIQDKVIPALESATRAVEESASLLSQMQREREIMKAAERLRNEAG